MRKKFLLMTFLTLLLTAMGTGALYAQDNVVTIDGTVGGCTSTTSMYVPIYNNEDYAISQQYYLADEIAKPEGGTITSIAFQAADDAMFYIDRNLTIYMVNTSDSKFSYANKNMKQLNNEDIVFSSSVPLSENAGINIALTKPFEYTGGNILLCVVDNTGDNTGTYASETNGNGYKADYFKCFYWKEETNDAAYCRSLYKGNHNTNGGYDPTTSSSIAGITSTNVPCVQFTFEAASTAQTYTYAEFNALIKDNGSYDGTADETVVILKDSERSYQNNKTAQFFIGATNVNITDPVETVNVTGVTFMFDDDDLENAYTSGELQIFAKDIEFTNCTFIGTAVSPWGKSNSENAETATFTNCIWQDLSGRYGVHQNRASELTVTGCTFENCERGIHTNSSTVASITITNNRFTGIGAEYGVLCLAENGNVGNATLNINGNTAEGQVFLRQLNTTTTYAQVSEILDTENNTYGTAYVNGSTEPAAPVAKIGDVEYATLQAAVDAAVDGDVVTLIADVTENEVLITQKADVDVTIDGNDKTFTGHMTIFGSGRHTGAETLTIQNVVFQAVDGKGECIASATNINGVNSYAHNVTIDGCSFKGNDTYSANNTFAIRFPSGGVGYDLTVKNCTADNKMFGLLWVTQVVGELIVDNCTAEGVKEGIVLTNTTKATITETTIDASNVAIRAGQTGAADGTINEFTFNNNTLKSDAIAIQLRGNATDANLSMEQNVVSGTTHISGNTAATNIAADANYWDGNENPTVDGTAVLVDSYYTDNTLNNLESIYGGEGTEANPFTIANIDALKMFRDRVNAGKDYSGKYFQLTSNITLTEAWTPIGNGSRSGSTYTGNAFKGVFDGNEKTIDGLNIANGSSDETKGLFGVVDGGTVKNFKLTNVNISTSSKNVGAAAGLMVNNATIDKVEVSGTLTAPDGVGGIVGRMIIDGTISNCTNNATVTATLTSAGAGGIVGKAYYSALNKIMSITNCTNNGAVTCGYAAGGITALSAANVSNCSNTATITAGTEGGGIIGEQSMYGTVTGNTNSGLIKNNGTGGFGYGGIIGWVRYSGNVTDYPLNGIINVTNNTNTANIEATGSTGGSGGIVGHIYNQANVTGNTNKAEHIYGGAFAAGIAGSLQQATGNLDIENTTITVSNNISLTSIENITVAGLCKDLFAYNNDAANFVVKDNLSNPPVAKIGDVEYTTLQEAVNAAKDGEEIDLLKSVELTSTLLLTKNNILDGNGFRLTPAEGFTPDGNGAVIVLAANMSGYEANRTYTVKNLTIEGFSTPSRIVRANFCNATIQNCSFVNNNSESIITSAYAVLNVEDNTFTDNTASFAVINVGSDVSDGTALVAEITGNKFYNNEAAIAGIFLASSADVTDNHFKDNTHTGDNANAAAILAGPYTGSMAYTVNINSNAFENAMSKDGTALPSVFAEDWSANYGSTTSFDLSLNYWDGNEPEAGTAYKTSGENPQVTVKSYYRTYTNKTLGDLVEYPQGDKPHAYVSETTIWGQTWTNAKESYVIKVLNAENEVMGTSALNTNLDVTMDGDVEVTWHITLPGITDEDQYWIQEWIAQPNVNNMPAKVELWVDGVKVNEGPVQFNGPDNINKIYAATADAEGKLIRFYNSIETIVNNEENVNVVLVRDVTGSFETFHNVTLYSGVKGGASITNTYSADYTNFNKVIVKNGVTLNMNRVYSTTAESVNTIEGTMNVVGVYYHSSDAKTEIKNGGKVTTGGMTIVRYNNNPESGIYIYGDGDDATIEFSCQGDAIGAYSGTFYAEDAVVETKGLRLDYKKDNSEELDEYAQINAKFVDTKLSVSSELRLYKDAALTLNGATVTAGKVQIRQNATPTINIENSTIKANSVENLSGATWNAVMDEDGYVTFVRTGLAGEGTEANPYLINNLEDLVFFRDQVNGGNNYAGKYVKLAADINLESENWTPIGDITYDTKNNPYKPADDTKVFSGVFDGNDKVISKLTINRTVGGADTQANVGLFGITGEGSVIKNLTLSDVNITTDGRNVGALAGFAYKATLDNITVNGKININGGNNVSGVAGMTRYHAMSATNIKVIGNDDSAIVGNNIVGGIFAEIAPNGSVQTFENLSVENVAITGASGVGGIVGLLTTGAVDNVTVKNVVLTGRTDYQGNAMGRIRLGSIAGLMGGQYATIANVTVENVTAMNLDNTQIEDLPIIGANYDASSNATEAKIGDTYYATLQTAIAAVQNDETITLLIDTELSEMITIPNGKTVVLDLNGKTITGTDNTTKNFSIIDNRGNLTITDSSDPSTGKITLTATTNSGWNRYSAVIANNPGGKLTIEAGTLEHLGGTDMAYGIDNLTNGKGTYAETVINGGTIKSTYRGIRQFLNGIEAQNILTVNGGTIEGANKSILMQDPNKNANTGTLTVGESASLKGDVYLFVEEGSTSWPVEVSIAAGALEEGSEVMTANLPVGVDVQNINGTYSVVNVVAQIGDVKYQSLADAATAAQSGETIQLIWAEGNDPISMAASFYGKDVTITGNATVDWSKGNLFVGRGGEGNATVTFDDANLTSASDNASTGIHVSGREKDTNNKYDGTLVIKNGSNIQLDYLIDRGTITIDNATLTVKNGFGIAGRPATETVDNNPATATISLENGAKLIVNNHNGMGVGQAAIDPEGYGIMNIDAISTFETTQNFNISANGTMNNAGTVKITGTLTNNGTINFTDDAATLATTTEDLTINYNLDPDKKVAYIDGVYKVVDKVYVAQIGEDNKFETLQEAFDAAQDGDEIVVLKDIVLTEGITVAADKTVALDLNGKTITGTPAEAKAFAVITNKGNLTITDGTETEGKIVCDHKLAGSTGYAVNTITNSGTLTIVAGTIQNTSTASNQIGYAIDNNSTTGNTILVIEGDSKVTASGSGYYDGIRQFCNSETNENSVTIKGGEVSSLWLQNPSDGSGTQNTKDVKGSFAINGGTLNNLYLEPSTQFAGAITGGHVGNISRFQTAEGRDLEGFITGGTFSVDPTAYCAQGYSAKDNGDGTYSVIMTSGTQEIALALGWNWFSSYIDLSGETGLEKVQTALGTYGVQIKGKFNNNSSSYQDLGNGTSAWIGDFDLSTKQMYMINTSAAVTMEIEGDVVDREETTISLGAGWNWISYPLYETLDINEALANHNTATDGDAIKTLDKTSVYYSTLDKWIGDLTELTPGQGYMYKSANATSFVYSAGSSRSAKSDAVSENKFWKSNANKFANNMTVVAMLSIDGEIVNDNYEIAAFANGECRGSARPVYVEELDQHILFLTINGEDVQELTFKYYDVNYGTVYELNNRINYSNDAVLGSIDEPYMFNLGILNIEEATLSDINIYPNPTTTGKEINLEATCDKVEVFNALGVKVAEYSNVDSIDAIETAGIYVIRVTIDGDARNCRLVVK